MAGTNVVSVVSLDIMPLPSESVDATNVVPVVSVDTALPSNVVSVVPVGIALPSNVMSTTEFVDATKVVSVVSVDIALPSNVLFNKEAVVRFSVVVVSPLPNINCVVSGEVMSDVSNTDVVPDVFVEDSNIESVDILDDSNV